ncbi:MAG: B12-binding domain-containing radical SAM protein [Methanobrevibacter sp.]|jgi:radical SAM superfamily enzyme YgiQ (UPF0313 family)|nr:B12-binding domain-containing radical SAM protein [Candidatus Methanovirga meridionalis]
MGSIKNKKVLKLTELTIEYNGYKKITFILIEKLGKNKMKIIIVKPGRSRYNKQENRVFHGIGYIIQYAQLHGCTIDYLDLFNTKLKEFKEKIKGYDLVGYSIVSFECSDAIKAISINRKANENVTIVVGGIDPSIDPDKYIQNPLIDHVITGEGEISFFKIIQAKKTGKTPEKLIIGEPVEDLDSLGFINRDLFPEEEPSPFHIGMGFKKPFFSLITNRVCVYKCKFCQPCSEIMFGSKKRFMSAENVVSELNYLKNKYGLQSFAMMDDNALQNREWCLEFIERCKKNNFKVNFSMFGRANDVIKNEDLLEGFKEIGLKYINIGFESGSNKILKYLNKGTTVDLYRKALFILNKHDIEIFGSFMIGFPFETKEDIKLTENFIKENELKGSMIYPYFPYPGSYLHEEYKKKNLIFKEIYPVFYNLKFTFIYRLLVLPMLKGVNYYYISLVRFRFFLYFFSDAGFVLKPIIVMGLILSYVSITIFYLVHYIHVIIGCIGISKK